MSAPDYSAHIELKPSAEKWKGNFAASGANPAGSYPLLQVGLLGMCSAWLPTLLLAASGAERA